MCLNGTKNFPGKGIISYFENQGAHFGRNINAATGVEQTTYQLTGIPTVRQGVVDTALLVMHDYSRFVTNDPKEIDDERGVILEERRTRRNASWRVREKSFEYLFKGSKYATNSLIGSEESLKTFKPESLVRFYDDWYHPGNQAVLVVGDIDPDYVVAKLTEVYSDIPLNENPRQKEAYFIPDNEAREPAESATYNMLRQQLNEVMSTLTPRECKVLRLRFGLEDGRPHTLEEVGKEFDVTRERVRQIESKALRKLRHPSRSKILKDFLN